MLGNLTKQLAKEALAAQVEEVVDSLRGPEAAAKAESLGVQGGPAAAAGEPLAPVILAQVQAMQGALRDDQELIVTCTVGRETLRVFEIFAPSPHLLVLTGIDAERNLTRVISAAAGLQLVCRPAAVKDGKAVRLKLVTPKGKGA